MSCYQIISLIASIAAVLVSSVAAFFTYKNLREIRKQFFEQNRGNLIFYVQQYPGSSIGSLIVKNFGNSPAKLLSVKISPDIIWGKSKCFSDCNETNFSDCENIYIVPRQLIKSDFDFEDYPDTHFNVTLKYETNAKVYTDSYEINLSYSVNLSRLDPEIKDNLNALIHISQNIQQLSDRFL